MEEKKLSKKLKIIISLSMVVLVLVFVIGINQYQLYTAKNSVVAETEQEQLLENSTEEDKPEAKFAMTQVEMEEAIAKHKMEVDAYEVISDKTLTNEAATENQSVIDFEGLWEINPDVYAWISIPGTKIEYPMLQHATDNSYYLNYNIDGSFGYPGCIYTENMNSKDFTDPNTMIYGHNMKNGTMFTDLHKYKDKDFFQNNDEIIITTPDKTLTYQIFASYVYDNRHLYYSFDFTDETIYKNYLQAIFDIRDMSANINQDIEVNNEDKIITLVTCIGNQPDNRLLLQAVLLEE